MTRHHPYGPPVWYKMRGFYIACLCIGAVFGAMWLAVTTLRTQGSLYDEVTDMECFKGGILVYEGVAHGRVHRPQQGSPWYFTDYITGEKVVRDTCLRSVSRAVRKLEAE